jgi:mono/diheme cytochrome c family protein
MQTPRTAGIVIVLAVLIMVAAITATGYALANIPSISVTQTAVAMNPPAAQQPIADLAARVAQADPARGQLLYTQYGCIGCHGTAVNGPAPYIGGTGSRAATRRAGYSATAYLYESITNPNAFIVQGYPTGLMPQNFKQTIPESDLLNLIAYIAGQ